MPQLTYSACVGMLFAPEAKTLADRIRLAAEAGFEAVEFWGWRGKELDAIGLALEETGAKLVCLVSEPMAPLTDPSRHRRFLSGLEESRDIALQLGARILIAQAGDEVSGVPRADQHKAIRNALEEAAFRLEGSGVTFALEPLNTRVDHPGYYLHSTSEGLDLIEEVNRPEIRLLYDMYHSYVMDEPFEVSEDKPDNVLIGRTHLIAHVHLADAPGRNEPGTGDMNWRERLAWLAGQGYSGYVGLEYRPTNGTLQSLQHLEGFPKNS